VTKPSRDVSHCDLAIYIKKYLKATKEYNFYYIITILFSEMLKFSKLLLLFVPNQKDIVKENNEY
jgi:ABC-type uncharacterized transport system permease subunit